MTDETDRAAAKARAELLHSQIADLAHCADKKGKSPVKPAASTKEESESPRAFIHRRMAELDKK